jgi:hypothetical protein
MANGLEAGRPLELDWLAGKVVALGRKYGVPTPTQEAVYEAAVVDLFAHQSRQRSTNFSVCRCRVLSASRCDIAVDTTCYERFEIGFAAVARVP